MYGIPVRYSIHLWRKLGETCQAHVCYYQVIKISQMWKSFSQITAKALGYHAYPPRSPSIGMLHGQS